MTLHQVASAREWAQLRSLETTQRKSFDHAAKGNFDSVFRSSTTMTDINENTPSSPARSRRPSVEPLLGAKKTSRESLRLLHEMQGLKQAGTHSAPNSRRPSVVSVEPIRPHIPVFPGSTESSAPGTPVVQVSPEDFGSLPFTPPLPKSPSPQQPPPPDFDKAPYSKPIGTVFEGDQTPSSLRVARSGAEPSDSETPPNGTSLQCLGVGRRDH